MILLIDNYDSFSYNLYQLIGSIDPDIQVVRNDAYTLQEIQKMAPDAIIISPGPGRPKDAGICEEVIRGMEGRCPILGVCLGEQAMAEAYGATITYAKKLMHGKQSMIKVDQAEDLFRGLEETFPVARYHSLAVDRDSLPEEVKVIAWTEDQEVMAIRHKTYKSFGVQFHPESIMTPDGEQILRNFLEMARAGK
ncbi:MAG: aminodeoxychorismate/anthranilate synthase component II [Lachnospiraceae bacterium]|nr:aminodeoxychorismate/anthranilate synthase component II [Lachnospiraceae bacterium]